MNLLLFYRFLVMFHQRMNDITAYTAHVRQCSNTLPETISKKNRDQTFFLLFFFGRAHLLGLYPEELKIFLS